MSCRVLRSNKKVLPDGSIASVKKSRQAILQFNDELSNTPKESENEDVLEKKVKKKRIRRTENSILIDDSSKMETTLNGRCNTESSNYKPKKSRRKDCSLIFDSSSDYDSVFEGEEVFSKKTRKTRKKYKLPTFQLDDCQQYNPKMQKLRQESDTNNSKTSKESNNISNVVYKNKTTKQNRMENKTSKQKDSPALIPTDVKKKLKSNTSIESIYFTSSPMKTNQSPNLTKLTKYENNSDSKTEARKSCSRNSGIPNGFVYEGCTSEESDSKTEHQVISGAIEERINNSNELVSVNGYFCSETITTPLKPSFSDDSSETSNLNNSHPSSFKQNTHVEDVFNNVENGSDSEIEFDCCLKDPVQISSDFPMMIQNASVEESNKKEENTTNNSKKIWIQTKINSRTDTKNPNISMSVETVKCGDICLDNTENSMTKQNEDVRESFGKRARKRWTILEGNEAKKSFNAQMDILRRSLLISRNNQNSPNNNVKFRRTLRKRWSDELKKSVSALDISKNSKHDVDSKINSHSDDKLENPNGSNRLTTNSRRSRFSSSSSIDRSANEFTKTTPRASIDNLSKSNRRTFEIQKDVKDSPLLMSTSSKISNGRRSRLSSSSSIGRSAKEFTKTTPRVSIDNPSKSNINCSKRRTFEIQKDVNDSPLLMSTSSKISNGRRSRFPSGSSIDRSANKFTETTPHVSIDNSSKSNINCSKRRTFEIQMDVEDSPLLMSTSSKISNGRPSRFSSNNIIDESTTECPAPRVSVDNLSKSNNNSSKRRTFDVQESVTDTHLLKSLHSQTSDERRSRFLSDSSVDTSATRCHNTTEFVSVDNLSKSNLNSSKRRTFEIQKSVIDSPLLVTNSTTSNGRDYKDPVMLKRRDTYELEESVADVNILRTLSDSTFNDIGVDVLPSENSIDFSTSKKVNYENVTRRKILDRSTKESKVANGHNSLINKSSKRVCFKNSTSKKRSMSLEKPFSPTTFISSTPKCVFQSSSVQKSINTDKHLPLSRRRSKSADEGNTRITRIKMPNFAKIHQKAREKMENIVQLTERKAERAKLLLSGQKPNDSRDVLNSDNNARDVKHSQKQLTFDTSKPSTSRGFLRVYQGNPKKEQLKVASTKIPIFNEIKSGLSKDVSLKVAVPEKNKNAEKTRPPKAISLKKVTQFGFKIRSDACSENKPDQIKAIATKTKLKQDNRAEQRSILKGVRSNKRFELLMKMRKK